MIGVVVVCKDEERYIQNTLLAVKNMVDWWTVVDTGSTDRTKEIVRETMQGVPGELHDRPWVSYGANWTEAMALARGKADWLIRLDADWKVSTVPDFAPWLNEDPDPTTDIWQVPIFDSGTTWHLPLILRGDLDWKYLGPCHEYLDAQGRKQRQVLGIEVAHMRPGGHDPGRFHEYIRLLMPDAELGEPRATFYVGESYRFLGETEKAIEFYRRRENIHTGFEEERWYSAYQAARLSRDVEGLINAWRMRPWRHEALAAASVIVAEDGPRGDVLFLQECRC